MDDCTNLVPLPKTWLRLAILAPLLFLAAISSGPWGVKLVAVLAMIGVLGTFPAPRINGEHFEKTWFVVFFPVYKSRRPLAEFVEIETDLEQRFGLGAGCAFSLLVGVWNVLMIWLLDWLIPWAGGDYKLWLRSESGRLLAWQGNGEANFRHNLAVLEDATGLPVSRA